MPKSVVSRTVLKPFVRGISYFGTDTFRITRFDFLPFTVKRARVDQQEVSERGAKLLRLEFNLTERML